MPGLTAAFDPERFHDGAADIVSRLTRYLGDRSVRGLDLLDPSVLLKAARGLMTPERQRIADFDTDRVNQIVDLYTRTGIPVYSPGYMGRQFSGVVPLADSSTWSARWSTSPPPSTRPGSSPTSPSGSWPRSSTGSSAGTATGSPW
ncbi:hypothetical protein ACFQX6_46865 [Streptosporangium lutulentum]